MDTQYLKNMIRQFLAEDIGHGDITSEPIFSSTQQGKAFFIAKDEFITAGLAEIAPMVFQCQNKSIICEGIGDGTAVKNNETILTA